jgi:molybdopterin converting factor small subunit
VLVRLHAGVRERAGRATLEVEVGEGGGGRASDLLAAIARALPDVAEQLPSCRLAAGDAFLAPDARLPAGVPVDLVPPVSGG